MSPKRPTQEKEPTQTFLTLREASAILGVHPATLRAWADQGKVPTTRTAGGHRRFAEEDIRALLGSSPQAAHRQTVETLIHSALGRTRMEISEGRLSAAGLYAHYSEAMREQHRRLGQRLLRLVLRALTAEDDEPQDVEEEVQTLGKLYAELGRRNGLSLRKAVEVFIVFRDMLLESALQMSAGQPFVATSEMMTLYRHVNNLVDRILLVMVESYAPA
jgi:excisionase family DNA binding protein